jgi:hypothetical protein
MDGISGGWGWASAADKPGPHSRGGWLVSPYLDSWEISARMAAMFARADGQ